MKETEQGLAVKRIAHDLASVLQRGAEMGICIVADVDDEGTSYAIEAQHGEATVEWDPATQQWRVTLEGPGWVAVVP